MNLIAGKINTLPTRTQLYEKGDELNTISYIKSGSVTMEGGQGSTSISAGNFIATKDIYSGFYSADYYAEGGTEIIPILADSPSSFTQY